MWLPGEDFSQKQKESYPCLAGIDRRPIQPVGHAWGDPRVIDGAAVAAVLQPVWQQLKLYRIQCVPQAAGARPMFELYTRAGERRSSGAPLAARCCTNRATTKKSPGSSNYAAAHGGLDGGLPLDVRTLPAAKASSLIVASVHLERMFPSVLRVAD